MKLPRFNTMIGYSIYVYHITGDDYLGVPQ